MLTLRTQRYKLIQTFDVDEPARVVFEELYDLQQDPKETRNLADDPDYSTILTRLRGQLQRAKNTIRS